MTEHDFSGEIQWLLNNRNIIIVVVVLIIVVLLLNPLVMIGAGERGVILNFGAVQETVMGEGLHLRVPIMQKIIKMDVKIQKAQTDSSASTKDLQNTICINIQFSQYHQPIFILEGN